MEKFMKKMWKKSEGFTLVELIVVIAILGILAAVAVPAYSGYMDKAKEASDITELDAIKTAALAYYAETGAVTKIEVTTDEGAVDAVLINGTEAAGSGTDIIEQADFIQYLTGSSTGTISIELESESFEDGATWNGTDWQ